MSTAPFPIDRDRLADFTLRLVAIQSPSGKEGEVAKLVAAEMETLGLAVAVDAWGNVTGTLDAGPGPTLLIDSHTDTVGVTEPEAWSRNPWGEIADGRIYGRGSMDMKGPLAASVYGVAALKDRLPHGKAVVSASIAEELVEGPALVEVARRVLPNFVVICEATSLRLARGQRGRAEVQVRTHGRPTHSSRPDLGVNAAQAMVDVIVRLREIDPPSHPILGQGILVLTDILSQPYPGLSVVPDACVATFDRRTLPEETESDILDPIREAIGAALDGSGATGEAIIAEDDFTSYTGVQVHAPNFAPAWFYDEGAEIVRRASAGLLQAGIEPALSHYAFCTNGSGTAGRLGIPTVGFGPGEEALAHRVDEYIAIDELARAAAGYAGIAQSLLSEEA
jgi:putative selenium metabolism hydrolase